MNSPQVAFVGNDLLHTSEEVQAKINKAHISYDPFEIDNFKEALRNLPSDQMDAYRKLCILTEEAVWNVNKSDAIIKQARRHRFLMNCIKIYWKEAEIYNHHPSLEGDC